MELQRRKAVNKDLEVYYWKDHQQNEIDFALKEKNKIVELIQVTFADNKEEIKEREIKRLIKASSALKCKNLTILTWNYESEKKSAGKQIKFIPLWKWLLEEK